KLTEIKWKKDGTLLELLDEDDRRVVLPNGSLFFKKIIHSRTERPDEGLYQCIVTLDGIGTILSREAKLQIAYESKAESPHFVAVPPKNAVVLKGSDLTLDCAANGNPKPRITWLKDGSTIDLADLDSRFRIIGSGSLMIENIREEDAGTYMCRAVNSEIQLMLVQQLMLLFLHTLFEYFQIVNGKNLKILGAVKSDSGIYQCFATNSAGAIQASTEPGVLDADSPEPTTSPPFMPLYFPNIPGQLQYHKEAPSAPENVTAIIVNTRFITLSWEQPRQRNKDILYYVVYYKEANSTRERFHNITRPHLEDTNIQGLQPDTGYVFRVVAYNQHGPGMLSKELFEHTLPDINVPNSPNSLVAIPLDSTSVLVKWSPPEEIKEPIQYYKLHYMEVGVTEEHSVNTTITSYELHEITVQTYSDKPSATPQNVTLEPASSSMGTTFERIPKWNNYWIQDKSKKKKNGNGETYTTDGSRRLYALVDLEKGAQYVVKIAALSVNGSGPFTEWKTVETYSNDLMETTVPDMPSSLRARPSANSIFVSWGPPRDQTTVVRGYKIGWGIGLADVYSKTLDGKQRYFSIENLQPSSEYVISLRAFNEVGDGRPVYETVKTQVESTPEPFTPMLPPVGLKAIVLSASTVVLYWTDTTLSRNQVVTDNRYYTVRYTTYAYLTAPKYKYFNSTDLNCMIDDLKPNTQYEFSVKVVKGRKESTWSMSVLNTTQEAAPSSPPRDLTVVPSEDDNTQINLHWQPPKQPNGHITGYVIFYTTDKTQRDRDWVVEGVVGYGPLSSEIAFHTAPGSALLPSDLLFLRVREFLPCVVKCRAIRATPIKYLLTIKKPVVNDTSVVTSPGSGINTHPYDIGTNSFRTSYVSSNTIQYT
ncbi:neogenin, partial [Caerostris extrusa]